MKYLKAVYYSLSRRCWNLRRKSMELLLSSTWTAYLFSRPGSSLHRSPRELSIGFRTLCHWESKEFTSSTSRKSSTWFSLSSSRFYAKSCVPESFSTALTATLFTNTSNRSAYRFATTVLSTFLELTAPSGSNCCWNVIKNIWLATITATLKIERRKPQRNVIRVRLVIFHFRLGQGYTSSTRRGENT